MNKPNSEFVEPGIPGTCYVAVKLNDGLYYKNYTAKIKDTSINLVYDDHVKKFFYENYKSTSTSIIVVITETSTGKTQEITLTKSTNQEQKLNIVDKSNSEFIEPGIPGTCYVAVKLNDGLDYKNYTAKIKDTSINLVYDDHVKKFFYENYKSTSTSITVVITETSTGKTQEITLTKSTNQDQKLNVVDNLNSEFTEPGIPGTCYVAVKLNDGLDYSKYTAKIKDTLINLVYDDHVKKFFYENYKSTSISIIVVITEISTGKTQEITLIKSTNQEQKLNVIDKSNSEFVEPGIPGTYYVAVKLNDGLDYNDYTAKIKDTSVDLVYDDHVKKFFYENYKSPSTAITIVITERSSRKTQEIILNEIVLPKTK